MELFANLAFTVSLILVFLLILSLRSLIRFILNFRSIRLSEKILMRYCDGYNIWLRNVKLDRGHSVSKDYAFHLQIYSSILTLFFVLSFSTRCASYLAGQFSSRFSKEFATDFTQLISDILHERFDSVCRGEPVSIVTLSGVMGFLDFQLENESLLTKSEREEFLITAGTIARGSIPAGYFIDLKKPLDFSLGL